ncbi:MAG: hypothetical protein EON58_06240 [Alphaproteobacteria bacterium]|nr:MAG: hypothetical protein EON58_06240 [Alphaproteobacteria bacterium]
MNGITYLLIFASMVCNLSAQLILKKALTAPAMRESMVEGPLTFIIAAAFHPHVWIALAIQATGYGVWFFVLTREKLAVSFAIAGSMIYIMTAFAGWYFYSERLMPWQWLGIILISVGVVLVMYQR